MTNKKENVIMGVDPGTRFLGYGVVLQKGNQFSMCTLGVVKTTHLKDPFSRLQMIHNRIVSLLKEYRPDSLAIEAPFYDKNIQTVLKLGRVQGIVMGSALSMDIPVFEYSPKKIKQAITGNGNATKEQVSKMVQVILNFKEENNLLLDATDALATAMCHGFQSTSLTFQSGGGKKSKGGKWESFLKENSDRIIK